MDELQKLAPKTIGALGRKVERLLRQEFQAQYRIVYLVHPAAAARYPKQRAKWDSQFEQLVGHHQGTDLS